MDLGWLAHFLGLDNLSGPFYGFWSGFGSDLGELTLIGAALSLYWRHNCHVKGCIRLGRHAVNGTPYVVCKKHHPTGAPSHGDVLRAHQENSERE